MLKRNEIRIRDPFVITESGLYYLLGTTGNDCWNAGSDLTLYVSRDMTEFERVGCMTAEGALSGYTQIWAPELHRYREKYYLIVSVFDRAKGRGSIILVSDSVRGKFTPLTGEYITPNGWWCLDASLFVWKGEPYLYFSNEWINPVSSDGDGALFIAKLSDDLTSLASPPKKVVSGKHCGFSVEIESGGKRGYVAEGPFAVEKNGRIFLYWSTFTEQGYCVAESVSDDIFGDYKFDKLIFQKDGGHAMIFRDLQGIEKIVLHQPNESPLERMQIFELKSL